LRNSRGEWILSPKEKANLFNNTFVKKSELPPESHPQQRAWSSLPNVLATQATTHTTPTHCPNKPIPTHPEPPSLRPAPQTNQLHSPTTPQTNVMSSFNLVRTRWTLRILKQLSVDSATGPDQIPARILKECARELALPITLLVRSMLREGCWPMCWRVHWIIPIYKRKAVSDPSNYRGVHLTTLLSKVAERIINSLMTPFLQKTGAFGTPQFAFQKGLSANDLIAYLVCYWILCLTN